MPRKKKKLLMFTRQLLLMVYTVLLVSFSCGQSAHAAQVLTLQSKNTLEEMKSKQQEYDHILEYKITNFEQSLAAQKDQADKETRKLEALIESQKNTIYGLELQIKSLVDKPLTNGTTFEVWSGILLGSVAVIVTVLGVFIALLSFWGYKELIAKGTQSASLVAAEQTKLEFDKFITEGKLNAVIAEGIYKIMYRGISSDPQDEERNIPSNE